jgi:cardiolipin synthase (CMP-forming)
VNSPWRHLPNLISVFRILLLFPIAVALLHRQLSIAIALFALAACSDAADGFLARRFGWQSELGGILDPIADKLLAATVFVSLSLGALLPRWLMATAVARDLIIVAGAIAYRLVIGKVTAHPSPISKLNTFFQALFILCVVAHAAFAEPAEPVLMWLGALTFVITVVSGLDYVLVYGRRAAQRGAAGA